jgi:hypothetical protein
MCYDAIVQRPPRRLLRVYLTSLFFLLSFLPWLKVGRDPTGLSHLHPRPVRAHERRYEKPSPASRLRSLLWFVAKPAPSIQSPPCAPPRLTSERSRVLDVHPVGRSQLKA